MFFSISVPYKLPELTSELVESPFTYLNPFYTTGLFLFRLKTSAFLMFTRDTETSSMKLINISRVKFLKNHTHDIFKSCWVSLLSTFKVFYLFALNEKKKVFEIFHIDKRKFGSDDYLIQLIDKL